MLRKSLRKHVSNQSSHFQILEDTLDDATVVVKINLRVKEWAKHLRWVLTAHKHKQKLAGQARKLAC